MSICLFFLFFFYQEPQNFRPLTLSILVILETIPCCTVNTGTALYITEVSTLSRKERYEVW